MLITLTFLFAVLDLFCEIIGLPDFVAELVHDKLEEKGVHSSSERIRIGMINWMVLEDVTITDPQLDGHVLLRVNRLTLKPDLRHFFDRTRHAGRFEVEGGQLDVPLKQPGSVGYQDVRVSNADLRGYFDKEIGVVKLRGTAVLYDQLNLKVDLTAVLPKPVPGKEKVRTLSIAPFFNKIPEAVSQSIEHLKHIAASAEENTQINVESTIKANFVEPDKNSLSTVLDVQNLFYDGVILEQLRMEFSVNKGEFDLQDLRLQIEEEEFLQASAHYDREAGLLTAKAVGQVFPIKLTRVFAPKLSATCARMDFVGPAPRFQLTLHPSPVDDLQAMKFDLKVGVRHAILHRGDILFGEADISYEKMNVTLNRVQANLGPNVRVEASGKIDLENGDWFLRAIQDGPPETISKFLNLKPLELGLKQGFQGFEFSPLAPPHFELDIVHTLCKGKSSVIVHGDMSAKALSRNGVDIDSLNASVFVDVNGNLVVIDDLTLMRNGMPGSVQLGIDFSSENGSVDFDAASNIDSNALMLLIWHEWDNMLTEMGWKFTYTPAVYGSGYVSTENPMDHQFSLRIVTPETHYQDSVLYDSNLVLDFNHLRVNVDGTLGGAEFDGIPLKGVRCRDLKIAEGDATAIVEAKSATIGPVVFKGINANLDQQGEATKLRQATCDSIQIQTDSDEHLLLKNVTSPLIDIKANGQGVSTSGYAAEAFQYRRSGSEELARAHGLNFDTIEWADDQLSLNGKMMSISYEPYEAKATEATLQALIKGDSFDARVEIPEMTMKDGITMSKFTVGLNQVDGKSDARFNIDKLGYMDMTFLGVKGKFDQSGDAFKITKASCKEVQAHPFVLKDVIGSAHSAFGMLAVQIDRAQALIVSKETHDKKGKPNHPLVVDGAKAIMDYKEGVLNVRKYSGRMYDGTIVGNANYDFNAKEGSLMFDCNRVDLGRMENRGEITPPEPGSNGFLRGSAALTLVQDKETDLLNVYGSGAARLRDAELWKIPLVTNFLRLVKIGKGGKITKVDANIRFSGDRVDIIRADTDGGVISVKSNGYYWWRTGGIDMRFESRLFRVVGTSFFASRRMLGSVDDYDWVTISGLQDLFHDKSTPVDPTTLPKSQAKPGSPVEEEPKPDPASPTQPQVGDTPEYQPNPELSATPSEDAMSAIGTESEHPMTEPQKKPSAPAEFSPDLSPESPAPTDSD